MAAITALAVIASGLAAFALDQNRKALEQRNNAIFDRVTAEADRQRETNGALAAQLDLVAYQMRPTAALRTRLMTGAASVQSTALPERFDTVHSVAFSPDGQLATGTGALRFWNVSNPTRPAPLTSALSAGTGVGVQAVYSTRGDLLARGGTDGTIRILDVSDAKHPKALFTPLSVSKGAVMSLKFSPDNQTLALATTQAGSTVNGTVQLWSVSDPQHPRRLSTVLSVKGRGVSSVAFSPDGATLAASGGTVAGTGRSSLLRLWDVSDPAHPAALGGELDGHTSVVNQVTFSPDGRTMASAASDRKALVWDVSDRHQPKAIRQLILDREANSVAFSPDGHILATGEQSGSVKLWNVGVPTNIGMLVPELQGHTSFVNSLAFDATGRTLASGGGDGRVLLWRLPPTMIITGSGQAVNALTVTRDGRLLAVASGPQVSLWDLSDPTRLTPLGTLPRFPTTVNSLAFRPGTSGQTVLATGESGGAVSLWDVSEPAQPTKTDMALPKRLLPVNALAFDADGRTLVAASWALQGGYAGQMSAWAVADPAHLAELGGGELSEQKWPVRGLAAAPQGRYFYTADLFGSIRVWRTGDGTAPSVAREAGSTSQFFALAVDPRSRLIATGSGDSRVRLWDVSRQGPPTAVGAPLLADGVVYSVGFAPDGRLLASGDNLGQVRLWDTSAPAHTTPYGLPISGHSGEVVALQFSPGGGLLITGGQDGTVRLWQTDTARTRAILCEETRRAMTATVWKEYVSPVLPYDPPCNG